MPQKLALLISHKLNRFNHPPLFVQNVQIEEVDSNKHVGVFLSDDSGWHQHINDIKDKIWFRINMMRKLNSKFDKKK